MTYTVPVACNERRWLYVLPGCGGGVGGGGWIWTIKRFLLVDHHCSGMRSILAVDSLLIQIIIISGNLNKCINGLYASWDHHTMVGC